MLKMNTTNRYDKYKDSGIEWIGEIPVSWNVVKLKQYYQFEKGKNASLYTNEYIAKNKGLYPVYSGQTENNGVMGYINTFDYNEKICVFTTTVGAKVMSPKILIGKFSLSQNCLILKKINNLNEKFLYYQLLPLFDYEKSLIPAYMQPSLRIMDLKQYLVIHNNEQNLITKYLDRKCGAIDETIEKQKSVIEKLKEYKQSIITHAVTKGLDKSAPMKDSGIEWIGQIPQHWEISKIKFSAIVNPKYNENLSSDTLVSFAPMECLTNCNLECKDAILDNVLGSYTYFTNNDIIMAKVTPCFENGNIALATNLNNGVGFGSSELYVFRSINIYNKFLLYLLQNTQFKDKAIATMYGTGGLKRVSIEFVKNYKFACPDIKEQEQIAEFLDKKCSEIDKTIEDKEKLIEKLVEYKKSLIYECVTGKRKVVA